MPGEKCCKDCVICGRKTNVRNDIFVKYLSNEAMIRYKSIVVQLM